MRLPCPTECCRGIVRAKIIVFPEFSNMQIGLSVLLFLCLLMYFDNQKKRRYLLWASVCLCLLTLSYPSCIIVYFPATVLLTLYSGEKWKDVVLFSAFCFFQGMAYVLFFIRRMSVTELISNVRNIIEADSAHGVGKVDTQRYFFLLNRGCIWLAGCLGMTLFAGIFLRFVLHKKMGSKLILIFATMIAISDIVVIRDMATYSIVYIMIILWGITAIKYCNALERKIYITGLLISTGTVMATFLLTNLEILSVAAYMILGVMVSFIPISKWSNKNIGFSDMIFRQGILILFCAMLLLRRGVTFRRTGLIYANIFDLGGVIRSGPAAGIVTDYFDAYVANCDMEDWEKYVNPQDRLLLVGNTVVNAMPYLYQNTVISIHSTISTPTYDEKLLE